MTVTDEELNALTKEKQNLLRKFDSKEIDEEKYYNEMNVLQSKINEKTRLMLERVKEENKMADAVKTEVEDVKKRGRPAKTDKPVVKAVKEDKSPSYNSLAIKALTMKTLNTLDKVTDKVLEWKPGKDRKVLKSNISALVSDLRKERIKSLVAKYTWDENAFCLVQK